MVAIKLPKTENGRAAIGKGSEVWATSGGEWVRLDDVMNIKSEISSDSVISAELTLPIDTTKQAEINMEEGE
jgi:putative methionine-R-sulfoxide reductase with GAF domain